MSRVNLPDARDEVPIVQDGQGTYHAFHDASDAEVSTTVTLALAEITGREPEELVSAFEAYVDPDALDRLFRPRGEDDVLRDGVVEFTVEGYEVAVHGDGTIEIRP